MRDFASAAGASASAVGVGGATLRRLNRRAAMASMSTPSTPSLLSLPSLPSPSMSFSFRDRTRMELVFFSRCGPGGCRLALAASAAAFSRSATTFVRPASKSFRNACKGPNSSSGDSVGGSPRNRHVDVNSVHALRYLDSAVVNRACAALRKPTRRSRNSTESALFNRVTALHTVIINTGIQKLRQE